MGREEYKQFTNKDFKESIDVSSQPLDFTREKLLEPRKIMILDHYLLVQDSYTQKHLHIFDIKKKKYLGTYLAIGNEANEISDISVFNKIDDTSFIVYNYHDDKYLCFTIDDILNSSIPFKNGKVKAKEYPNFLSYDQKRNILFSAGGFTHKNRLYEENLNSKEIIGYEKLLEPKTGLNIPEVRYHLSTSIISRNKMHFAFAYVTVPLLEIFDYQKKELTSVLVPHQELPKYHAKIIDGLPQVGYFRDSLSEFGDIIMTDKHIYALYGGRKNDDSEEYKHSILYVFDYKLNPIRIYNLDTRISSLAIHENLLYALKRSNVRGGGEIVTYELLK